MRKTTSILALAATLGVATLAYAAVTFDPQTGEGFVGKGDVQLVFGWNNKQLQENANSVQFRFASVETETWTCSRPTPNPNDLETERQSLDRHRSQGIAGAPDADPRQKKGQQQFTGFILSGYIGEPEITEVGGQALNSCPGGGEWTYDVDSNDIVRTGAGLEVGFNGVWFPLQ